MAEDILKACVRRDLVSIHIPGSTKIITFAMLDFKGKMLTVVYEPKSKDYVGGGWHWHGEWLKFKNNIDPNKKE